MTQNYKAVAKVVVSEGSINNYYISLQGYMDSFPIESIGGSNKSSASDVKLCIEWGGVTPTETDIDGNKKMFRKRDWVREFFDRNLVRVGDVIIIEQTGGLQYRLSIDR